MLFTQMDQFTFKLLAGLFGLFIFCPNATLCGRIVGVANHYYSHQSTMRKLGKELVSRGHRYSQLIPYFLANEFKDVHLIVFNTSLTSEEIEDVSIKTTKAGDVTSLTGMYRIMRLVEQGKMQAAQLCQDVLTNASLITELKENVDLLLCDISSTCCFILADMLNITRVDVSSMGFVGAAFAYYFGFPQSPVYLTQETTTDATDPAKFSFKRRLVSFVYYGIMRKMFVGMLSNDLWVTHAKPTSRFTNILDAWRPHNLVLIGHDFALEYPRPIGPHVKVIGAILPNRPKSLPEDLRDFMSTSDKVVVVSFGSVLSSDFNSELVQVIAEGLGKVSATVLWKQKGSESFNVSRNINMVSWIPQNDLLGHTSTKVFVTHCGANSLLESAYHGVPMVAIPLSGDQHRHAAVVQVKGLGVTLDKTTMKAEDLTQAIHEVLSNKLYKENAERISALMRDRHRTPVEEGADWIEYALRHNGANHLISEALDLPEYQLYCFDLFLFLLLMIAAIIFTFVKVCRCICGKKTVTVSDKLKKN